jgi:hypothetical protein
MQALLHLASSIVRDVAVLHAGADRRLLANGDMGHPRPPAAPRARRRPRAFAIDRG